MPTILITGGNGQLGKALGELDWPEDYQIFCYGREQLDIGNNDEVRSIFRKISPDLLINAAAYTAVDKAEDEPEKAYAINDIAVANLGAACMDNGNPMVHISTDYVFSGEQHRAYKEEDVTDPCNVYGASKLAGEKSLEQVLPEHVIVRTSGVFSDHGSNFVKAIIRAYLRNDKNLRVVNDQICGPIWAGDLARAVLRIAENIRFSQSKELWGTFHLSSAPAVSWFEFACEIIEALPLAARNKLKVEPIPSSEYPTRAKRPGCSIFDCSKLDKIHGIGQPSRAQGLVEVIPVILEELVN
ncbi:MAG: dTDP-4-dehydrorhamnose reductase [Gammaproteobacteria bacterium]|nr:dTDP-4-dehydrorhamnose reductase [Gammaproteobacteria bacterium]